MAGTGDPIPPPTGKVPTTLEPSEDTVVKLQPVPVSAKEIDNAAARATQSDIEFALKSVGQREINLIWEDTQMKIALSVVFGVMAANLLVVAVIVSVLAYRWSSLNEVAIAVLVAVLTGALSSLTSMGSLVIGFYFGRTNHQKTGGVGGGQVNETR